MQLPVRSSDVKRILLILHGSIGDVTRALPLATVLRKGFPRSYIAWSVEPASRPLLEHNPAINQIILFDRVRGWRALAPFLRQIREKRFDLVLDLQRILKSGLISWATGAPLRIGFNRADAKELNWVFNNLHIEAFDETIPKIEHYFKFTDYLGLPREAPQWDFYLTAKEQTAVQNHVATIKRSFAVLFVGTRWQSKRWFAAQIARCTDLIHDQISATGDLRCKPAFALPARTDEKNREGPFNGGNVVLDRCLFLGGKIKIPLGRLTRQTQIIGKFKVMLDLRNSLVECLDVQIIKNPVELLGIGTIEPDPQRRAGRPTDQATLENAL